MIALRARSIADKLLPHLTEIPDIVKGSYFNSLDGLRAVSILMVITGHLNRSWGIKWIDQLLAGGNLGVCIFFVISGFLITTLLLKEKVKSGTISLKQFYIRRTFRIFPVAYLYLLVLIPLNYWMGLNTTLIEFITAFLFVKNLPFPGYLYGYTTHYWSLAVEEQFYLIFPVIIKWSVRRYTLILLSLIVFMIAYRFVTSRVVLFTYQEWVSSFLTRGLEGILVGSLFSVLMFQNRIPFVFFKKWNFWLNMLCILAIVCVYNNLFNTLVFHLIPSFLTDTILYVVIAVLILINLPSSDGLFFKILNNKIMIYIGVMSFSLYIWQQIFIVNDHWLPGSPDIRWYSIPLNVTLLFVVAYLSYKYYEQPLRNWRRKIEKGT